MLPSNSTFSVLCKHLPLSPSTAALLSPRRRGFALIVVLMLVALMTVLIVAIFTSVQVEMRVSYATASGQNSKELAEMAVQTVISQIQKATTQGAGVSWASQPGMIRCYDSAGVEVKWYKLYTSQRMVQTLPGTGATTLIDAEIPVGGWATPGSPGYGVYTDMNSPVIPEDGGKPVYPILDPTTNVLGLDVDLGAAPTGYDPGSPASALNNPAAMPVRWLYVLADGKLVPGIASGAAGQVSVAGSDPLTNPIVGRIAFWTDDETCKLNVNTAADGTYFDTPRFASPNPVTNPTTDAQRLADKQMAVTPPIANEYQRYVGHPAQTRLSHVLPRVRNLSALDRSKAMTSLSPFLQWGGSEGGSKTIWEVLSLLPPDRPTPYASLDEWMFSTAMASAERKTNVDPTGVDLVTNTEMKSLRFVLSATSEAPEVNLYGKPRISIWPITNKLRTDANTPYATTQDKLIASAATLNQGQATPSTYYFTRENSGSPTSDYVNIPRNQEIFRFLRTQAGTNVPGYGDSFAGKYGVSGADQILTEIFDYIRSTNPSDMALLPSVATGTNYSYASYRLEDRAYEFQTPVKKRFPGRGQVVPIYIADYGTKGFGRFYSISEVAIDFTRTQTPNAATRLDATQPTDPVTLAPNLYLGLFSPSLGPVTLESNIRIEVEGMQDLKMVIDGTTYSAFGPLPAGYTKYSVVPQSVRWHSGNDHPFLWGGAAGPRQLYVGKKARTSDTGAALNGSYGLTGNYVTVPYTAKLSFPEQAITIKVYYCNVPRSSATGEGGAGQPDELVQELAVRFPAFNNIPVPTDLQSSQASGQNSSRLDLSSRFDGGSQVTLPQTIRATDIIRSMVTSYGGDMRLIAGQRKVPESAFVKHPNYNGTTSNAHSMRDLFHGTFNWRTPGYVSTGKLVQGVTYALWAEPVCGLIDPLSSTRPDVSGDFDNGPGIIPDGPYINKVDEVGLQYYAGYSSPTNFPYYFQGDEGDNVTAIRYSSPNRVVASPVMFGSLPTGVPTGSAAAVPWRTLLFRPQANHFGSMQTPKDSLMLDNFWMPVVEPYAISTPLATAGKVNLNYQIVPFTYITRATALMGVLGSEQVIAVPTMDGSIYKNRTVNGNPYRFPVKVLEADNKTPATITGTLRQFKERFATGAIFRSAADICDIYLVPGQNGSVAAKSWTSNADAEAFWALNKLTGDNTRERPYNGLYSRLTTKSNTYTVHVRTQVLKMPTSTPAGQWIEKPELIMSEYRGSAIVNRYLNPEDSNIPDFMQPSAAADTVDNYYKYRVLETRRFLP